MRKVEGGYGKAYKTITYACMNLAELTVILAQSSVALVTSMMDGDRVWVEKLLEQTNRVLKSIRTNVDSVQSLVEYREKDLKK